MSVSALRVRVRAAAADTKWLTVWVKARQDKPRWAAAQRLPVPHKGSPSVFLSHAKVRNNLGWKVCSFVREKVSVLCFKGHLINMDIRICGCVDVLLLLISLCRPNFLGTIGKVNFNNRFGFCWFYSATICVTLWPWLNRNCHVKWRIA